MKNAKLTRRSFVGGLAAGAAVGLSGCRTHSESASRWYKGMLHAHSLWSDGRVLPEQAVKVYKNAGYDFFALTEHNRIAVDSGRWFPVGPEKPGWPPKVVTESVYEVFRRDFPDADVRTLNGKREVRLATYKELCARFNEPGRFLFLPGCEITTRVTDVKGRVHDLHMNYVGLEGIPKFLQNEPMCSKRPGNIISDEMAVAAAETEALAASEGSAPYVFFLNHPQWRYYDILPQDVIDAPSVRFFELCNNGSTFEPDPLLPQDGLDNDRFWDVVNAVRATKGQPLLYAVASDDTHSYPGCGMRQKSFCVGDGWISVRASSLAKDSLINAMHRGEFYASSGVDFEDIDFDAKTGRLSVEIPAKKGVAYTVRFITTKRTARLDPVRTVKIAAAGKKPARDVPVYSDEIGAVAKTVSFAKGERAAASYTLAADDLYVRARVESDEPSVYKRKNRMHPFVKMGWTQPYRVES